MYYGVLHFSACVDQNEAINQSIFAFYAFLSGIGYILLSFGKEELDDEKPAHAEKPDQIGNDASVNQAHSAYKCNDPQNDVYFGEEIAFHSRADHENAHACSESHTNTVNKTGVNKE